MTPEREMMFRLTAPGRAALAAWAEVGRRKAHPDFEASTIHALVRRGLLVATTEPSRPRRGTEQVFHDITQFGLRVARELAR